MSFMVNENLSKVNSQLFINLNNLKKHMHTGITRKFKISIIIEQLQHELAT
jgi:hypothetical protein